MNTLDPDLIARRLSRPARFLAGLVAGYLAMWMITAALVTLAWVRLPIVMALMAASMLVQAVIPALLVAGFYLLARGVKRRSWIPLAINILLISLVYLGIAALALYGVWSLPEMYTAQLESGAHKGWLIAFLLILAAAAIAVFTIACRRWYGHALATTFLMSARQPDAQV